MRAITLAEFKESHYHSGVSVMDAAYHAQHVSDDEEFRLAATAAIQAEDKFSVTLAHMKKKEQHGIGVCK